ncbi:MAG: 3-phosphoshikimate 1-carboxyvinyltransferase [Roseburia sp.]|nr:3-phosphoshikimate 1-carboxyvinyltransferase [Roseburia sp.]MCM1097834.1 3-phosphoshikimate 1-carboxyvinyltransferase [Ruminococcus flavefaciens]
MNREIYQVPCIDQKVKSSAGLCLQVPGSKSITNRALLLAALADGTSVLRDVLFSEDSRHFLECIQALGLNTQVDETKKTIVVEGMGGKVPLQEARLNVGSAGTAARFLSAWLGLSKGVYHMDASEQMRKRPMAPLLDSLKELGCEIIYEGEEGHFPFTLKGNGFRKNQIAVNIDKSSQFLSALLIASCLSEQNFWITTEGSHGMSYIEMTVRMMQSFGVQAEPLYYCSGNGENHNCSGCINSTQPYGYRVPAGQRYHALDYQVEPDLSAACYFYALSPLLGIPVTVQNIHRTDRSLQGDIAFLGVLEQMGCAVPDTDYGVLVQPPAERVYHGVDVDMSSFSDQAITLAALAPFADSPTTIRGIGHIRHQESDRIAAIATELGKMGILCEETDDSITIHPGFPSPSAVETYDDHRMAMGFSLIGLRAPGIIIRNPDCCRKTFEGYFDLLDDIVRRLT